MNKWDEFWNSVNSLIFSKRFFSTVVVDLVSLLNILINSQQERIFPQFLLTRRRKYLKALRAWSSNHMSLPCLPNRKPHCWVRNFTINQSFVIIFNWCFLQLRFGARIFSGWQIRITRHQKCAFQRKEYSRSKLAQVMSTIINYSACPNSRHKNYYQRK